MHLVEDLHMPLHVGENHDKGGNKLQVRFFDRGSNLHRVWDSGIITPGASRTRTDGSPTWSRWTRRRPVSKAQGGTVEDWATESLLAAREAYQDPATGQRMKPGAKLGDAYQAKSLPVAKQRLYQAGRGWRGCSTTRWGRSEKHGQFVGSNAPDPRDEPRMRELLRGPLVASGCRILARRPFTRQVFAVLPSSHLGTFPEYRIGDSGDGIDRRWDGSDHEVDLRPRLDSYAIDQSRHPRWRPSATGGDSPMPADYPRAEGPVRIGGKAGPRLRDARSVSFQGRTGADPIGSEQAGTDSEALRPNGASRRPSGRVNRRSQAHRSHGHGSSSTRPSGCRIIRPHCRLVCPDGNGSARISSPSYRPRG